VKATLTNQLKLAQIPEEIRAELIQRLQLDNPVYLENQRMGRWNRGVPKILRYYRRAGANGLIVPRGLMRQLILICRRQQEPLEIEDRRRKLPDVDFVFHGRLKPFQQEAFNVMLSKEFGTLSAPTGSGKTVMALHMVAARRQPTLVIVHTKDLAFQWVERIHAFLGIAQEQVGMIGAGHKKIGNQITVAMVQSLYKCAQEVAPRIGHLVVDECHRAPSRTFTEAVTAFDSRFMLGLSATPWRRDRLSQLIFWHLGDVHHEISKSRLVADGHILDVDIIFRQTEFKPYYDPANEYSKMLSELTCNDDRNRLIASDVAKEAELNKNNGGICLLLSDRKRHCETLQAILKHKHGLDAHLITGDLTAAQRREVIGELKQGHVRILIATGQLIGEGFDHPGLSTLFLATPVRFSGRVLQYLGRVLRPTQDLKNARVYDYVDIHVSTLVAAAKARQRVYLSQKEGANCHDTAGGWACL
jgi:superfamily II DNA or RNA helicase